MHLIDLGYMNSWSKNPELYDKCVKEKHKLSLQKDPFSRCITHYYCPKCRIKFSVDSSD